MRTISDTPAHERHLMICWRLSERAWERERGLVTDWLSSSPKTLALDQIRAMRALISRPLAPTEVPLLILLCHSDIPEGTRWDTVFDPKDLDAPERTEAVLRLGVLASRVVSSTLEHGWHQVAVIDFPDGVPALIRERVPVDGDGRRLDFIGLCAEADFPAIGRRLRA